MSKQVSLLPPACRQPCLSQTFTGLLAAPSMTPTCFDALPGRCSEAERDRIEEQVGLYMRSCTDNIARLEASLAPGQPGIQSLNPHGLAHRHGVVQRPALGDTMHNVAHAFSHVG